MIMKDSYFLPLSFAIDCIQTLKEKVLGEEFVFNQQFRSVWKKKAHAAVFKPCDAVGKCPHAIFSIYNGRLYINHRKKSALLSEEFHT